MDPFSIIKSPEDFYALFLLALVIFTLVEFAQFTLVSVFNIIKYLFKGNK